MTRDGDSWVNLGDILPDYDVCEDAFFSTRSIVVEGHSEGPRSLKMLSLSSIPGSPSFIETIEANVSYH